MDELFESAVRSSGDLAGVFEFDGEVGYFYLCVTGEKGSKIIDSMGVFLNTPMSSLPSIAVEWDASEQNVGLVIDGILWAIFDCANGKKFGEAYSKNIKPNFPTAVAQGFRRM
ncbi:DUF2251 domain-containing protein [Agrobacterium rhizogenes]|uniref:DUF2251 domain-containing protein n=1 Tax=Rhizobium rhizogenes TaxID=359 RepID=UPI001574E2D7|nr:DUF2251 domain-containing protein [Rhizobium rhizogenes]NTG47574.1 DUF2251 domain-containing protein [Rhizobium rhizogenes]